MCAVSVSVEFMRPTRQPSIAQAFASVPRYSLGGTAMGAYDDARESILVRAEGVASEVLQLASVVRGTDAGSVASDESALSAATDERLAELVRAGFARRVARFLAAQGIVADSIGAPGLSAEILNTEIVDHFLSGAPRRRR